MLTDRWTDMTKLIVAFCNFVNAPKNMFKTSVLFWDITWHRVVTVYRRFGTTYRSHLHRPRVLGLLTREDVPKCR
jgi:hypothetical protein